MRLVEQREGREHTTHRRRFKLKAETTPLHVGFMFFSASRCSILRRDEREKDKKSKHIVQQTWPGHYCT